MKPGSRLRLRAWPLLLALGCADLESAELELEDDAYAYVTSRAYRRAILERDLVTDEPHYAQARLQHYASSDDPDGWDEFPVDAPPSLPLTLADAGDCAEDKFDAALALGRGCDEDYVDLLACASTWSCAGLLGFNAESHQRFGLEWKAFDEKCPGILL